MMGFEWILPYGEHFIKYAIIHDERTIFIRFSGVVENAPTPKNTTFYKNTSWKKLSLKEIQEIKATYL